jgi:hypothetical protein
MSDHQDDAQEKGIVHIGAGELYVNGKHVGSATNIVFGRVAEPTFRERLAREFGNTDPRISE